VFYIQPFLESLLGLLCYTLDNTLNSDPLK